MTENLQIENGKYTRIANKILDELVKAPLLVAELQVCLFIIRKTYGFNKTEDEISLQQFQDGTGKSRPTVVKALKNLQLVKVIELVKRGDSKKSSNIYKFNKYSDTWELVNTPQLVKYTNSTSKIKAKKLVKTPLHTKDNTKDNTKDREQEFIFPEWLPKQTFLEYNKQRKKKLKPESFNRFFKSLKKITETTNTTAEEILNQSIVNGWEGIFPLKTGVSNGIIGKAGNYKKVWTERDVINANAGDEADRITREWEAQQKAAASNTEPLS